MSGWNKFGREYVRGEKKWLEGICPGCQKWWKGICGGGNLSVIHKNHVHYLLLFQEARAIVLRWAMESHYRSLVSFGMSSWWRPCNSTHNRTYSSQQFFIITIFLFCLTGFWGKTRDNVQQRCSNVSHHRQLYTVWNICCIPGTYHSLYDTLLITKKFIMCTYLLYTYTKY